MKCEKIKKQLLLQDGSSLNPILNKHLETCSKCQQFYDELQQLKKIFQP